MNGCNPSGNAATCVPECPRTLPYEPVLVLPKSILQSIDPAWASCDLDVRGSYDPPYLLTPQPVAANPTPESKTPSSPPATPIPPPPVIPRPTASAPDYSPSASPPPPHPPSHHKPPSSTTDPSSIISNVLSFLHPPHTANDPGIGGAGSDPGPGSGSSDPGREGSGSRPGRSGSDGGSGFGTGAGSAEPWAPGSRDPYSSPGSESGSNPGAVLGSGSPGNSESGSDSTSTSGPRSSGNAGSGNGVSGNDPSHGGSGNAGGGGAPAPVQVGGQPVVADPAGSGVVIGGQTLRPGTATTVGGISVSVGNGGTIVAGSSTLRLPLPGQASPSGENVQEGAGASAVVTVGDQTYTANSGKPLDIDGTIVSPNSPEVTISGHGVSIGNSGVQVGSQFTPFSASGPVAVFTVGASTYIADAGQPLVIGSVTLTPGGPAATISGETISMATSGSS